MQAVSQQLFDKISSVKYLQSILGDSPLERREELTSSNKRSLMSEKGRELVQGRYLEFYIAIVLWEGEGRCTGCKNRKGFELAV